MQNTCLCRRPPQPSAEEGCAGAAGAPAAAEGLGAVKAWPWGRAASRVPGLLTALSPGCLPAQGAPPPPCARHALARTSPVPAEGYECQLRMERRGCAAKSNPSTNPLVLPR